MASLESIQATLLSLEKAVKSLQRETHHIRQKLDDPLGEKAKARSENNSFKKPQQVSAQLKGFLGLGEAEMISRSEVTKRIFAYAKEKGLSQGKVINMDDSLKALLNPVEGQDITVTNIQKFINHHYVSSSQKTPTPPVSTKPKGKPKVVKA